MKRGVNDGSEDKGNGSSSLHGLQVMVHSTDITGTEAERSDRALLAQDAAVIEADSSKFAGFSALAKLAVGDGAQLMLAMQSVSDTGVLRLVQSSEDVQKALAS